MIAQLDSRYLKLRPTKAMVRLISYALFEGRPVTTRGRWINPCVFTHFAIENRLPQFRKIEKPVCILGTGRSGTTILGIVLSMHKDVGFLNEPKALWHYLRSDEDIIGNYSTGPARYRLGEQDANDRIRRKAHRIYGAYLAMTGSKRVVDKYPEQIFRVPYVQAIFHDAKFLFLVRDGWDTCASIAGWSAKYETRTADNRFNWWGVNDRKWKMLVSQLAPEVPAFHQRLDELMSYRSHEIRAAVEWILTMREGLRLMSLREKNILTVRFEDMVADPEGVMNNISEFCELSRDSKLTKYARETLAPVKRRMKFDMPDFVLTEFNSVMQRLGYLNE